MVSPKIDGSKITGYGRSIEREIKKEMKKERKSFTGQPSFPRLIVSFFPSLLLCGSWSCIKRKKKEKLQLQRPQERRGFESKRD